MKILCVIDLQPYFSATNEKIVSEIISELQNTINNEEHICLIQYELGSWIHPKESEIDERILECIEDYKLATILTKDTDSAAKVILEYLSAFPDQENLIRICGVNLEACIFKTIKELSDITNLKLELLVKCCSGEKDLSFFISKIANIKNVSIVV